MFKQNLDLSLSTKTVAHDKGSYMCPLQFLPTQHSHVLSGPSVASVAPLCKLDSRRTNEEGEKKAVPQYRGTRAHPVEPHRLDLTPRLGNSMLAHPRQAKLLVPQFSHMENKLL